MRHGIYAESVHTNDNHPRRLRLRERKNAEKKKNPGESNHHIRNTISMTAIL